jgi:Nucleotidyltransferase
MTSTGADLQAFARLIESLTPWLDQVVIIGGWAHRLHRLHPAAQTLDYAPLTTLDADVALPIELKVEGQDIYQRLQANGFQAQFLGENKPPSTHYHLTAERGEFYAEFLTPLVGSARERGCKSKGTIQLGGVVSQNLRHLELLLHAPWTVILSRASGFPLEGEKSILVARAGLRREGVVTNGLHIRSHTQGGFTTDEKHTPTKNLDRNNRINRSPVGVIFAVDFHQITI